MNKYKKWKNKIKNQNFFLCMKIKFKYWGFKLNN